MKKMNSIIAIVLALVLSLACLTSCGQSATADNGTELVSGGVLCLKVNPEIAISYDADGLVTEISARNEDAVKILEGYTGYEGKATRDVVSELVTLIGDAGYFVEEVEGESRKITIEVEVGSKLPSDTFLDDVIADVKASIDAHDWSAPIVAEETIYDGVTDYNDTDYGPNNDGVTDYNDTDYGPNNDGITDYNDTDYGPDNDGVTDYDATDYGTAPSAGASQSPEAVQPAENARPAETVKSAAGSSGAAGVTDYDDTDYDDTDYGPNNDGVTDYDDGCTDYDNDSSTDYYD